MKLTLASVVSPVLSNVACFILIHEDIATYSLAKQDALKSNSFDVRQTVFYAHTCKFGL